MDNPSSPLRYNCLNKYLKDKFGASVYKLSLDLGLSCPNVDGSMGSDGCIFCNTKANIPTTQKQGRLPLQEQIDKGIEYMKGRYSNVSKFIAYFQNYTNTYAPTNDLKKWYFEPLKNKNIVGVSISTRPDCVSDETLKVFEELSKETYLWIEYGLSSALDKTLEFIKRGHTVEQFVKTAKITQNMGIPVCAHIILGLPNETHDDMMFSAKFLNKQKIWGVKIHNLFILKDTALETLYKNGEFRPMTLDEYANTAVDFMERLSPDIIIHRFNSHGPRDLTVAPAWSINKIETFNAVEAAFKRRNVWQSSKFQTPSTK